MNRYEALLNDCEREIRMGHPENAVRMIAKLDAASIPREWRLPLAKICRRIGLHSFGLRMLHKLVNGKNSQLQKVATPSELAEYAVLLLRSGAANEAIQRLVALDNSQVPDALLFRAYAHFAKWEYKKSIPLLEQYVQASLSPHGKLVGRTNLAFAYVECHEHERARNLLNENIELARSQKSQNMETFNIAVGGQIFLQEGNYKMAEKTIQAALPSSFLSHTHDQFYPIKLKLLTEGIANRDLGKFHELKTLASTRKDWFVLREADFFSLKVKYDTQLFLHLYFGSPLPDFRESICSELKQNIDRSIYVLGPKKSPRFDLVTGKLDGKKVINPLGKCPAILGILLEDFYQPVRIASLHSSLYPQEHYNIISSPNRIRQVIHRTRKWLNAAGWPVDILEEQGFYSLKISGNFSFRVPVNRQVSEQWDLQLHKLKKEFQTLSLFSAKEIANALNISASSVHRLLRHSIEKGHIERLGSQKRPQGYRFQTDAQISTLRAS